MTLDLTLFIGEVDHPPHQFAVHARFFHSRAQPHCVRDIGVIDEIIHVSFLLVQLIACSRKVPRTAEALRGVFRSVCGNVEVRDAWRLGRQPLLETGPEDHQGAAHARQRTGSEQLGLMLAN
jgi:hypothetical protein